MIIKITDFLARNYNTIPIKHQQLYNVCIDWQRFQELEIKPDELYKQLDFNKEVING